MRTDDEIIAKIKEVEKDDWMGIQRCDLIERLPYDVARPYLKEGVSQDDWKPKPRDRDSVLGEMLNYMPFAWDKARNKRGLSAGRSMEHYMTWTWLIGDDFGNLLDYQFYGKDNLIRICERYGWDHTVWDDGVRENG